MPVILESIGVPHTTVESADTAAGVVRLAGKSAFGTRLSGACLLPRRVTTAVVSPQVEPRRGLTA